MDRIQPATSQFEEVMETRVLTIFSDLIDITKPRIMVLLLISTVCPMIMASGGNVSFMLVLWTLIAGGLVSGSASALNCVWDRDIDAIMSRTKDRPLAAGRLSPTSAVLFALCLGFLGIWIFLAHVNAYAAAVSLFGHLFYVLVYTMWLKRSTPQNIVIGGAAGAVPPIVGWVAVTGQIDAAAILLFLIIFLWTPPHFWALALNKNEDYKRAGVPMLPVVSGERATHHQMVWYALALVVTSIWITYASPTLGVFSLIMLTGLSSVFAWKVIQLFQLGRVGAGTDIREKKAWDVFAFSLVYLALFFIVLVIDSTLV